MSSDSAIFKMDGDSDEEVFFGIPTKEEWQINAAVKGYPACMFGSCNVKLPPPAKTRDMCDESQYKSCISLLADNSAMMDMSGGVSDIHENSDDDGLSLLCQDLSMSDTSKTYLEKSTLNQKQSDAGLLHTSVDNSNFAESSSQILDFQSVSISSIYNENDLDGVSCAPANIVKDTFTTEQQLQDSNVSSDVEVLESEYSTVRKLLKNWQIHDVKKQTGKDNLDKTSENISLTRFIGFPNTIRESDDKPEKKVQIQQATSLIQQAIQNLSAPNKLLAICWDSEKNVALNRQLSGKENMMDFNSQTKDIVKSSPLFMKAEYQRNNFETPPHTKKWFPSYSDPQKTRHNKTSNYSTRFKTPLTAFRSKIPRKVPQSATKLSCDVMSPVAKYIGDQPPPPLVKVIKCKENVNVVEKNAIKKSEISPKKMQFYGDHPVLPPAKYCSRRTHFSPPHQSKQTGHVFKTYKSYKGLFAVSKSPPSVTRHIGTSKVIHGLPYLKNEESLMEAAEARDEERDSYEASGKIGEMEQSMLQHANIERSNTILRQQK